MLILLTLAAVAAAFAVDPIALRRFDPRRRAATREARLALPGFVEAIGAALSAGLSLQLALAEVAATLPPPVDAACRRVAAALRLGAPLEAALASFHGVIPAGDLAPLAVVLGSFQRTGGRVQRSLHRIAVLLRGRLALEDEQLALTAQGRVSAMVLVGLAPLGALFFGVATPKYVGALLERGPTLVLIAAALETVGAIWLLRIVRSPSSDAELSSLLDAVVVGLDAGLTFERALNELVVRAPRVARLPEARRLLADLSLGRGATRSFAAFAASGAAESRIAGLVLAATRLGAPLAELLVAQADALREAERRRAEARARRLPILMLFPLTFCVLPALLIVFLGPPLLSLLG